MSMYTPAAYQDPAGRQGDAAVGPALFEPPEDRAVTRNTSVITVSDVHLKEGVPRSEIWCALAVSLREELHADTVFDEIEVTAAYISVALRHGSWWAETTPELYEFIQEFDATENEEGEQDPAKLEALQAKASAGLLGFPLAWHEGDPPEDDGDDD